MEDKGNVTPGLGTELSPELAEDLHLLEVPNPKFLIRH